MSNVNNFQMLNEKEDYALEECERIKEYLHNRKNIDLKIFTLADGTFFALFWKELFLPFTSYELLNKELIICNNESEIKPGEKKQLITLTTIEAVRKKFNICINSAIDMLRQYGLGLSITDHYIELLENQLIFDILFDKYTNEERMKASDYAEYIYGIMGDLFTIDVDSIRKRVEVAMGENCDAIINNPKLRKQVEAMGVDLKDFESYFTGKMNQNASKTKPSYVWAISFYNKGKEMITYRQYRREFKKDGNYSYERFIDDLKYYNNFVKRLLPNENETPKKYFNRVMDYYVLESYKRVDFDFKLVKTLSKIGISEIDKKHWLVKRFHPCTLMPYETNNELLYTANVKYYRPLLFIEDELHKQLEEKLPELSEKERHLQEIYEIIKSVSDDTPERERYIQGWYEIVKSVFDDTPEEKQYLQERYEIIKSASDDTPERDQYVQDWYEIIKSVSDDAQEELLSSCATQLSSCQVIHAVAYEIFKYHFEYVPSHSDSSGFSKSYTEYKEIKDFIKQNYNLHDYHEKNGIWKTIEGVEWKKINSERQRKLKKVLNDFIKINNTLFWESPEIK